jgi:tetratricopeptide (TPR) repeat protein
MKGDEHLWGVLNEKLDTLRATNHMAEAIRVGQSALEIAKRSFGTADVKLAVSYEKLGLLHQENADRSGAKAYLVNAHRLLTRMQPRDPQAIFLSARRLGQLSNELGQTEEAIDFYEQAVAASSQLPELPFADLGALLNNIALSCRKAGRPAAAEPYYHRALEIYESQLGSDHPDVASVLNNLGVFYTNERRFAEAEKIHLRALAIREKVFPASPPDIAQSKCNLAVVYHSRGDYERASELYRDSLHAWEAAMDNPPEEYEVVAANYADLLRSLGKARSAAAVESRARKKRRS